MVVDELRMPVSKANESSTWHPYARLPQSKSPSNIYLLTSKAISAVLPITGVCPSQLTKHNSAVHSFRAGQPFRQRVCSRKRLCTVLWQDMIGEGEPKRNVTGSGTGDGYTRGVRTAVHIN
ncbi:hypothetical protein PILCRDRAFT_548460 [Piloderma croceum F 1598]|uniref:Uncharacterized protein n=1 Tax=Piloderma croceum (strain F 1598) TaxID=765440 RepID=A0A0C3FK77_PILCF|nr:hypothetical protein PILCRDRAFT_548460 [Piloderma croceum F 1598]